MFTQPVIQLLGKYHARLIQDYDAGPFVIPSGFEFDGATMPWWVWSAIRLSPFGTIVGPACGHDLLLVNNGWVFLKTGVWERWSKAKVDDYFYSRCQHPEVEMNWLQERLVRRAVKLFGRFDTHQTSNCAVWNVGWLMEYNYGGPNAHQ